MDKLDKLYVVIPAYNEEDNIRTCVEEWYSVIKTHNMSNDSRLVIIDDGSKDSTYRILQELAQKYPLLDPIKKTNGGHGSAVLYGYRYAIRNGADYIFQTDSDGQTNPEEFDLFWNERDRYDAILGNRVMREDGKIRKIVENVVCLLLRLIFGIRVQDANAPFRLMKTELVSKYIDRLPDDYNLPNIMFTTYFSYFHESVKFIPISFGARQNGVNSINLRKIIKIGWNAVKDFYLFRKRIDR